MESAGIVAGIGPESTIAYYRFLFAAYRRRRGEGRSPHLVLDSIDVDRLLAFVAAGERAALVDYLLESLGRLARAGADAGLLAANTPHLVFDEVRAASPIPLVSIVEAARDEARSRGLARLGLFGTRFTMEADFFPEVFRASALTIVVPRAEERALVHEIYTGELLKSVYREDSRARLLALADVLRERDGIDGLVLGGTELPLLLTVDSHRGLPLLDTTRIHVEALANLLWPV